MTQYKTRKDGSTYKITDEGWHVELSPPKRVKTKTSKSIKKLPHTKRVYKQKKRGGSQHYWTGRKSTKKAKIRGWKKVGRDRWLNKERAIRLDLEKGETIEQYPYGVSIHSTFLVAGGDKYLKGFYKKRQALIFAKDYMKKHSNG